MSLGKGNSSAHSIARRLAADLYSSLCTTPIIMYTLILRIIPTVNIDTSKAMASLQISMAGPGAG